MICDYIHLEKFVPASKMLKVCKKIWTEQEIFNLLPKIDAFKFSMDEGCPIFEVILKGEEDWVNMVTLNLESL